MNLTHGTPLPAFRLSTVGGLSVALRDLLGIPTLYFGWASWDPSRDSLRALEAFHRKHAPSVRVVSIAFEAWSLDYCNRYLKAADFTHLALIDASFLLSRVWGVKSVPFVALADADGLVRFAEAGGDKLLPKALASLKKKPARKAAKPAKRPKGVVHPRVEILMQEGMNYLTRLRTDDALGFWRKASELDPTNTLIPRQMAALQDPKKTYA
jgi:hypothetical protein